MPLMPATPLSRSAVAIYVDILLLTTLLLELAPRLTGLTMREWVGTSLGMTVGWNACKQSRARASHDRRKQLP
jgi:hypothetical protein